MSCHNRLRWDPWISLILWKGARAQGFPTPALSVPGWPLNTHTLGYLFIPWSTCVQSTDKQKGYSDVIFFITTNTLYTLTPTEYINKTSKALHESQVSYSRRKWTYLRWFTVTQSSNRSELTTYNWAIKFHNKHNAYDHHPGRMLPHFAVTKRDLYIWKIKH